MPSSDLILRFLAEDKASPVFRQIANEADKSGSSMKKLGGEAAKWFAGLGLGAFAVASIKAAADDEVAQNKLAEAYRKFPGIADVNITKMRELTQVIQSKTGTDHGELAMAEAKLAQYKLTGAQIEQLLPLVNDYAISQNIDVVTAAGNMGKALLGNTRALKSVGIEFKATGDTAKDVDTIITALTGKVGGLGDSFGGTTAGQMKILSATFTDLQEEIGRGLVPALKMAVDVVTPTINAFIALPEPVKEGTTAVIALGAGALILAPRLVALQGLFAGVGVSATEAAAGETAAAGATDAVGASAAATAPKLAGMLGALGGAGLFAGGVMALAAGVNKARDAMGIGAPEANKYVDQINTGNLAVKDLAASLGADTKVGGLFQGLTLAAQAMGGGMPDVIGFASGMNQAGTEVGNFDTALAQVVAAGHPEKAAAAVARLGLSAEQVKQMLPQYAAAIADTVPPVHAATTAVVQLTAKQVVNKATVDALRRSYGEMNGVFSAFDKTMAHMAAQKAWNDDLKELNKTQGITHDKVVQAMMDSEAYAKSMGDPISQAAILGRQYETLRSKLIASGMKPADVDKWLAPMKTMATDAKKAADKIPKAIQDARVSASAEAAATGIEILRGLQSGMNNAAVLAAMVASARAVGNTAVNSIRAGAGVSSPSKHTIYTGEQIIEGLRAGMRNKSQAAKDAAQKIVDDILAGMSTARSTARDAIQATVSTMMGLGGVKYDPSAHASATDAVGSAQAAMRAASGDNSAAGLAAYAAATSDLAKAQAEQKATAPTAANIFANQAGRVTKMRRFAAALTKLQSLKLNKFTFAQILEAGPDGGGLELAEALGSATAVATENRFTGQLQGIANSIGFTGYAVASGGVVTTSGNNQTLSVVLNIDGKEIQTSLVTLRRRQGSLAFL